MPIPTNANEITVEWLSSMLPNAAVCSVEARRIAERPGETGQVFAVEAQLAEGSKQLVVKLPRPDQWQRSLREIRLLETVALPIHSARILSSEVEISTHRSALVLAAVSGDQYGVDDAGPDRLETLVHDLAVLHSTFRDPESLEKLAWLPRWGQGTATVSRPHKRRSDRYRGLVDSFLTEHATDAPGWVPGLLRGMNDGLEDRFAGLAGLSPTLIHADAHLDNVIFRKGVAYWLDWQSASLGPGTYDLARLLAEQIDVTVDLPVARRLVHAYGSHLAWHGVDDVAIEESVGHLPDLGVAVLVGFVSGYGGRPRADLTDRERALVDRAVTERGLFGFVRHLVAT